MRAADTNVIVRYLLRDDADQFARAARFIDGEPFVLPVTVILECEWVLRRALGVPKAEVIEKLVDLAGHPNIRVEDPVETRTALEWAASGFDFADAMHLARSGERTGLVTFDREFIRRAVQVSPIPVSAP
jgi:predicted nucleic-acid-binding protein